MSIKISGSGTTVDVKPVIEDPFAKMRENVMHQQIAVKEHYGNPAFPNNPFDFSRSGLPSDLSYQPVEVPNAQAHPVVYNNQLRLLSDYTTTGWRFLTEDFVSRDGVNGKAIISDYEVINGRVVLNKCFIMYASKDWYSGRRKDNVDRSNARVQKMKEGVLEGAQDKNMKVQYGSVEADLANFDKADAELDALMGETA